MAVLSAGNFISLSFCKVKVYDKAGF